LTANTKKTRCWLSLGGVTEETLFPYRAFELDLFKQKLKLDDHYGPFQPRPFCDSMTSTPSSIKPGTAWKAIFLEKGLFPHLLLHFVHRCIRHMCRFSCLTVLKKKIDDDVLALYSDI